jgi:hypothetical protein
MERKRGRTFPVWAPRELVDLCESQDDSVVDRNLLLHRLLTYVGMGRVWQLVQKHNPGEPGCESGPIYFAHTVKMVVQLAGFRYLTKGETVDRAEEILTLTKSCHGRPEKTLTSIPTHCTKPAFRPAVRYLRQSRRPENSGAPQRGLKTFRQPVGVGCWLMVLR